MKDLLVVIVVTLALLAIAWALIQGCTTVFPYNICKEIIIFLGVFHCGRDVNA